MYAVFPFDAYTLFTLVTVVAAGCCAVHASRGGRRQVVLLASVVCYGLALETMITALSDIYVYPTDRIVSIAGVPIAVALMWGTILYAGIESVDAFELPSTARPAFVAVYVLHVDLAIDAVAIRVPYWVWAFDGAWYGVPLGNFVGWFLVGSIFTALYELPPTLRNDERTAFDPIVALALSPLALYLSLELWGEVSALGTRARTVALGALLVGALAVTGSGTVRRVRERATTPVSPPARLPSLAVLLIHLFFLALLFRQGLHRAFPTLVAVSLGMIGLSLLAHLVPRIALSGSGDPA